MFLDRNIPPPKINLIYRCFLSHRAQVRLPLRTFTRTLACVLLPSAHVRSLQSQLRACKSGMSLHSLAITSVLLSLVKAIPKAIPAAKERTWNICCACRHRDSYKLKLTGVEYCTWPHTFLPYLQGCQHLKRNLKTSLKKHRSGNA